MISHVVLQIIPLLYNEQYRALFLSEIYEEDIYGENPASLRT